MNKPLRPARVPDALFAACGYFMPRLMFLQSRHAPQVHWGDIAQALQDFPCQNLDLASSAFWDEWMRRWVRVGDRYVQIATDSSTAAGQSRALRSAAACYHWAEFMYFDDAAYKTALRQQVRDCFRQSLAGSDLWLNAGEVTVDGVPVPYYLIWPERHFAESADVPCMILSNGLDSMTECEVLAIAEQYLERGIATLLFDGPGQGIHVGRHPLNIRMESVVCALVKQLRKQPRIDSSRLGFLGVSFGGYLALRVAQQIGQHFRCVVNLSGGPRVAPFAGLPRRLKEDFRFAFMGGDDADMQSRFDALELDEFVPCQTEVLSVHGALDDIFPIDDLMDLASSWGPRHQLVIHETEAHVCLNLINQHSITTADWVAERLLCEQPMGVPQ